MSELINSRNEWIFGSIENPFKSKEKLIKHLVIGMLNKTTRMFKYKNLPKTIAVKDLELQLQINGYAIFTKVNDDYYTFRGGLGGVPNPYYLPTIAVVANPALKYTKTLNIDEDCVVILNDHLYEGLMHIHNKYANLLADAELSLRYSIVNSRIPSLIQADNDNSIESAEKFFEKIDEGTGYGVIASKTLLDGIKSHDFFREHYIKDNIESIQYIKGSWYNELGVNAAFNMKREAINEAEASLNEDILYPLIDTMLECRRIALEKINTKYGLNISVELDSVWAKSRKQDALIFEKEEAEIEDIKNETN